ncbi:MAG: zf-HC2 domain-containing protein [Planctomycetota bacterium]
MPHAHATDLIKLIAGELPPARAIELTTHLATCSACRRRYEEHTATHARLNEWLVPAAVHRDLLPLIEQRLAQPARAVPALWTRFARVARVAAAILVGVGLGYGAARGTLSQTPSDAAPGASADAQDQQLAEAAVDFFAEPSPAGMYTTLVDLTTPSENGEGQS